MNLPRFGFGIVLAGMPFFARGAAAEAPQAPVAAPEFRDAGPVVVSRESQFDFTSRINGLAYRVMISVPRGAQRDTAYPVIYLLDGNRYFRALSDTLTSERGSDLPPAIVVAIGYPTESTKEISERRRFDFSLSPESRSMPAGNYGGGDGFIRVIEEEIKAFVATRVTVDRARQVLYGKSLGGLLALRVLLRHPETFSTYIIASPSIWWNDRQVLEDEAAFASRLKAGGLNLRVLITSAGNEQYRGPDPALREKDEGRMIDNAIELADRLKALAPHGLVVMWTLFPDESHDSVSLAALSRGLRFALPMPNKR
ncbi:MAG: alpha/beta hydrolase [Opitutaceae bacterium]|nr:alpha/beta hydrolase [Opitutaceae bacterium]